MFVCKPESDRSAGSLAARLVPDSGQPLIVTARGEVPLCQLQPGDMVLTRDNGFQAVRRITELKGRALDRQACITIAAGALGNGMPHCDTTLSAAHRVLVTGEIAALLFDEAEAFVAARHLDGLNGVSVAKAPRAIHLEFDHTEVVLANGCWTECVAVADGATDRTQRAVIDELAQAQARATDEAAILPG